jgi:membrane associated rhomboid family serine protease
MQPWSMIFTGFLLSILGVALPFFMLIHIIPSTFFLNFFSFFASVGGLIMGLVGAATYVRRHRK